ncbi:hypothetical protein [Wukongibacter sp. M2B1]|uniref:hypothetical protein n=1 Tax=Wukongibacter sp. M2B1 TaxID=3088895 RepID=UPI003D798BDD
MKKKLAITVFILFILCFPLMLIKNNTSNVYVSNTEIESAIRKHYGDVEVSIKSVADIENKKLVLGLINDAKLLKAEFESRDKKNYSFVSLASGTSKPYRSDILETSQGSYLVVMGINYDMRIKNILVDLGRLNNGQYIGKYEELLKVPQKEFYIVYKKLDGSDTIKYGINQMILKDAQNKDITKKIKEMYKCK